MSIISYPTPLFQNPPLNSDYYNPNVFNISAISLGSTTTVTTSVDHNFVIGQLVRLLIPPGYGSRKLNSQTGYVISLPADDQVQIDIPSYNVDAFVNPGTGAGAHITPVGDINLGQINTNGDTNQATSIPGSFINVSPQ